MSDERNELPFDVMYADRDWLYPNNRLNGSHYIASIESEDSWRYAEIEITDELHGISYECDFSSEERYNDFRYALQKLITALGNFDKALVIAREKYLAEQVPPKDAQP